MVFQKCFDKQATLTFEVRCVEAKQKLGGSMTARVTSTPSTLVPISEEEASSLNEILPEDEFPPSGSPYPSNEDGHAVS